MAWDGSRGGGRPHQHTKHAAPPAAHVINRAAARVINRAAAHAISRARRP